MVDIDEGKSGYRPSVWIVANTSWNLFNFRRALIARLLAEGYRVVALSPYDEYVGRLEEMGVRHLHLELNNAGLNPFREIATVRRVYELFRREKPGLLLSFTPKANIYACLAAGISGTPASPNVSGLGRAFIRGGWLSVVARILYWASFKSAVRVFFQNPEDSGLFIRQRLVDGSKVQLLPGSGVDVNRFSPRDRQTPRKAFVFLLVARLLRDKGIGEYVQAARLLKTKHPAVQFRLLGFVDPQNPTSFTMSDIDIWRREGVIDYLGTSDDVAPHYADSDCVVLPSYREGCPKTLLEAASMGKPLVATDVPGCRWVVNDGINGLLCRPYDASDLADKMSMILAMSPEELGRMGTAGREKMLREFDERVVLDEYMRTVREFANMQPQMNTDERR
jgi:glycosyltransferase involved in cell wall biosynthesis